MLSLWQATSALPSPGDWNVHAWLPVISGLDVGYHQWVPDVPARAKMRGVPLYRAPPYSAQITERDQLLLSNSYNDISVSKRGSE